MNIKCGLIAAAFAVGASFSSSAVTIDLTVDDSGTANGGLFVFGQEQPTGTGVFEPFVRIQHEGASGPEEGYNTTREFNDYVMDQLHSVWTHDLLFGDLLAVDGYYEFHLDLSEPLGGGKNLISLDNVQIYQASTGGQNTANLSELGTLLWNMDVGADGDSTVLLDAGREKPGQGLSDMVLYLPESYFAGLSAGDYIVFYSHLGGLVNYEAEGTFEEWATITGQGTVPEPLSVLLLGVGLLGFSVRRKVF